MPVRALTPQPASLAADLWMIRKIEEATVESYAACSERERREGDVTLARLHTALHEPADPDFPSHG